VSGRWFVDTYRDAVWESETLSAHEKAVAETYARHARDAAGNRSASARLSWLTYPRLMAQAGIGHRGTVPKIVQALVTAGWLTPEKQVSRRATVYRLTIPDAAGSSDGGTTEVHEGRSGSSDGGTTEPPIPDAGSSTSPARSAGSGTTVVPLSPSGSSGSGTQPLVPQELKELKPLSHACARASAPPLAADGERDDLEDSIPEDPNGNGSVPASVLQLFAGENLGGHTADAVYAWIVAAYQVRHGGWWVTVHRDGSVPARIAEAVAALSAPPPVPVRVRCGLHPGELFGGVCRACAGEAKGREPAGQILSRMSVADQRVADGRVLYAKYVALEAAAGRNDSEEAG
jgi:hypothetical protein